MNIAACSELPRRAALTHDTLDLRHVVTGSGRHASLHVILKPDRTFGGCLIIEQLAKPELPSGPGLAIPIPAAAHPAEPAGGETTFLFAPTLAAALDYLAGLASSPG